MAKNTFSLIFLKTSSIPFRLFSYFFEYFKIDNIDKDIEKSLEIIDKYSSLNIDEKFIDILIIAEDRRNSFHYGIDPIAIIRAIKVKFLKNIYQGASTIEQQFVRVVSSRYEKTYYRKIREQLLAIAVSKKRDKINISKAYLLIAYYGYNLEGIKAIETICGTNLVNAKIDDIIELVSRLKYPQPKIINKKWVSKIQKRNFYIKEMINKNKPLN